MKPIERVAAALPENNPATDLVRVICKIERIDLDEWLTIEGYEMKRWQYEVFKHKAFAMLMVLP